MIDTAPKRPQEYQLLPALDESQRNSLRQSIEANGILQPIEVDEDGRILDGHHRAAIAAELGIACPSRTIGDLDEAGKRKYALTVNLMRRQLDKAARAGLVGQLRAEGMSVRTIAAETGIPKSTISDDLVQLSGSGQLNQPERIQTAGGKEYPASRPNPRPQPATQPEATADVEPDELDGPVDTAVPTSPAGRVDPPSPAAPSPSSDSAAAGTSQVPAMPWPVARDTPSHPIDDAAHAGRVSSDIRRLITLAQTFGTPELRQQAIRLYADNLGNAPMPPSGLVNAQELRRAAESISALAKDWTKRK